MLWVFAIVAWAVGVDAAESVDPQKYAAGKAVYDRLWNENPMRSDIHDPKGGDTRITNSGNQGDAQLYQYYLCHTYNGCGAFEAGGHFYYYPWKYDAVAAESNRSDAAQERHRDYLNREFIHKWGRTDDAAAVSKWKAQLARHEEETQGALQYIRSEENAQSVENAQRLRGAFVLSLFALLVVGVFGLFILDIVLLVWVARDAKNRGMDNAVVWMLLVMFTIVGIILYLASRPKGTLVVCPHCKNKRLAVSASCPHCGNR